MWSLTLKDHGYDLEYQGESAAAFANRVVLAFIKPKRERTFSATGQCAEGGDPATEVDHIVPLASGGSSEPSNLQCLCRVCHERKTLFENRAPNEVNLLASEFEPSMYEAFHRSVKGHQIVTIRRKCSGQLPVWKGDKRSCRRSALEHCEDPPPPCSYPDRCLLQTSD